MKPISYSQAAKTILMIRPKHFGYNQETAGSNIFQKESKLPKVALNEKAVAEFDNFVSQLRKNEIDVIVIEDQELIETPDSIFPNNWFTTHHDGSLILYSMYAPIRNLEIREDITDIFIQRNYKIDKVVDLYDSDAEKPDKFLEGTGSLVFDHINRIAYANLSNRTSPELVLKVCRYLGYEPFIFVALNDQGDEIYHTNVMLTVSEHFAIVCIDCLIDDEKKQMLLKRLKSTGHEIIIISESQMNQFAGNMLTIISKDEGRITVMSQTAHNCLSEAQLAVISKHSKILPVPIPTIESVGGGSVRCMIAEIFLPRA